jgi:hypothetical protein
MAVKYGMNWHWFQPKRSFEAIYLSGTSSTSGELLLFRVLEDWTSPSTKISEGKGEESTESTPSAHPAAPCS